MIRDSHWLLAASLFLPSTATSLHAGQEDWGSLSQLALGEHCLRGRDSIDASVDMMTADAHHRIA
jgi:hypothetical protein